MTIDVHFNDDSQEAIAKGDLERINIFHMPAGFASSFDDPVDFKPWLPVWVNTSGLTNEEEVGGRIREALSRPDVIDAAKSMQKEEFERFFSELDSE